jgi:hypothetical protein
MSASLTRVFISYRRAVSEVTARLIESHLPKHVYDVFYDIDSIDGGQFKPILFNEIAARQFFILIVDKGTLERCSDPEDILRREIEYALELNKTVIPVLVNNLSFGDLEPYLPDKLQELKRWQAIPFVNYYFHAFMLKLRERYLREEDMEPSGALKSPSEDALLKLAEEESARNQKIVLRAVLTEDIKALNDSVASLKESRASYRALNEAIKTEMHAIKKRLEDLRVVDKGACPLCANALDEEQRVNLLGMIESDGKARGDVWRANKMQMESLEQEIMEKMRRLEELEADLYALNKLL